MLFCVDITSPWPHTSHYLKMVCYLSHGRRGIDMRRSWDSKLPTAKGKSSLLWFWAMTLRSKTAAKNTKLLWQPSILTGRQVTERGHQNCGSRRSSPGARALSLTTKPGSGRRPSNLEDLAAGTCLRRAGVSSQSLNNGSHLPY